MTSSFVTSSSITKTHETCDGGKLRFLARILNGAQDVVSIYLAWNVARQSSRSFPSKATSLAIVDLPYGNVLSQVELCCRSSGILV